MWSFRRLHDQNFLHLVDTDPPMVGMSCQVPRNKQIIKKVEIISHLWKYSKDE